MHPPPLLADAPADPEPESLLAALELVAGAELAPPGAGVPCRSCSFLAITQAVHSAFWGARTAWGTPADIAPCAQQDTHCGADRVLQKALSQEQDEEGEPPDPVELPVPICG
jgi:hypothetical protein